MALWHTHIAEFIDVYNETIYLYETYFPKKRTPSWFKSLHNKYFAKILFEKSYPTPLEYVYDFLNYVSTEYGAKSNLIKTYHISKHMSRNELVDFGKYIRSLRNETD